MEKNEELLERVANEIAAQNKLIALLIAGNISKMYDNLDFVKENEYLLILEKRITDIMKLI